MSNFVDCDRDQAFLLPPDLRDWLPADDLGHFVIEAVERVDLGAFKVNHRGTGSAQYHPRMMLALMIYCYASGIFSSRRIERATHRDIGVRFVAANRHPDHDTIARFRRENFAAVSESFLQVLLLAKELKLLRVGLVSVDGSKFKANASKHRSVPVPPTRTMLRLPSRKPPPASSWIRGSLTGEAAKSKSASAAGRWQPGGRHLVLDGAGLLVGDLGLQQRTDDLLHRMTTLEPPSASMWRGCRHRRRACLRASAPSSCAPRAWTRDISSTS